MKKTQMFDRFLTFQGILRKPQLNAAPDKAFFLPVAVVMHSHVITKSKPNRPLLNKNEAIQQLETES